MSRRLIWTWLLAVGCALGPAGTFADESEDAAGWRRIESRYCTIWLDPSLDLTHVTRRIKTWMVRPRVRPARTDRPEQALAAKLDTLFLRAQELLEMRPADARVTVKIAREPHQIQNVHASRYGYRSNHLAFYVFETNTIYVTAEDLTSSVLAHEMAHCIIDHYFQTRPPRKIEELLATHVDTHLRN